MLSTSGRAWSVWSVCVIAYAVAVFNRASLGVAALHAQHRLQAGAAQLSLFVVLQLVVYASLQIPVGAVLDRLGTRRMVSAGAVVMAIGQITLAEAHGVGAAIVARMLVGAGDAMTFISVLRLIGHWFPPRQAPMVTQLTAILGQLGQVAAAYPLVSLLSGIGWTGSFTVAAAVTVAVGLSVLVGVRDSPAGIAPDIPVQPLDVVRGVAAAWREPGTRLGLWTHLVTQFPGNVFALLWGYPFLVSGEGVSPGTAGALLTTLVAVGMVVGPLLGRLTGGWPLRRSNLTLGVVGATVAGWTTVLLWPGRAPLPVLVVLVVVLASNGPASMVGMDYARTHNPAGRLGSASGIVNMGGFVATLLTVAAVGGILDVTGHGTPATYSLGGFKWAFAIQYVGWALGLALVLRTRAAMRRRLARDGLALDPLHRAMARRWRTRTGRPV